ncbi:MAG: hypothetical protein AAGJ40_23670 [Planctomycetota bacterium]
MDASLSRPGDADRLWGSGLTSGLVWFFYMFFWAAELIEMPSPEALLGRSPVSGDRTTTQASGAGPSPDDSASPAMMLGRYEGA